VNRHYIILPQLSQRERNKTLKLTNNYKLPEAFERFEAKNSYSKGDSDISVTTLIDSPQIRYLKEAYDDEITEDISDRVMAIMGTAVHSILELGANEEDVKEKRFYHTIDGVVVSGAVDLLQRLDTDDDGLNHYKMIDYKTVRGTALVINPDGQDSWVKQLNCYDLLSRVNGYIIDELEIIAVVRDWNHASVRRNVKFPKHPVVRIPIQQWGERKTQAYMEERVKLHARVDPPPCTDDERWKGNNTYAVHEYAKQGGLKERAKRLFDTSFAAETFILDGNLTAEVVDRKSVPTRCVGNYCQVSAFCDQFQKE
jgi:hypothetical protein